MGELGFLEFTPQSGVEQADHRPYLVLIPESFNQTTGLSIVCPIRSRSGNWPFEVEVPEHLNIKGF
jgi:mRNA interferase MazF